MQDQNGVSDVEKFVRFYDSEFGKKITQFEAEYIYKGLRNCRKILDVGCGIGSIESNLPQLDIIGLDNSENMLNVAKKRNKAEYAQGDAAKLGFKSASFDAVLYVTTLEFLHSYQKGIEEAHRILKTGGGLLAMILNPISRYFTKHIGQENSYFLKVRHRDPKAIQSYISNLFTVKTEYLLGIDKENIFDSNNPETASLYVIKGKRK